MSEASEILCGELQKVNAERCAQIADLQARLAASEARVKELEDIITRYHPSDEELYAQLATLTEAVKGLPKCETTRFMSKDGCVWVDTGRMVAQFESVEVADAYAKLLALRAEMGG